MKANFCICNKCGGVLLDEKPPINAPELDLNEYLEMVLLEDELQQNGEVLAFWVCPNCLTDSYLSDMVAISEDC